MVSCRSMEAAEALDRSTAALFTTVRAVKLKGDQRQHGAGRMGRSSADAPYSRLSWDLQRVWQADLRVKAQANQSERVAHHAKTGRRGRAGGDGSA
jgi:hypothetical protein